MPKLKQKWETEIGAPIEFDTVEDCVIAEIAAILGHNGTAESQAPAYATTIVKQSDQVMAALKFLGKNAVKAD